MTGTTASLSRRIVAEAVGTAMLLAAVVGSGIMAAPCLASGPPDVRAAAVHAGAAPMKEIRDEIRSRVQALIEHEGWSPEQAARTPTEAS